MPFAFGPASTALAPASGPFTAAPKADTRGVFYKQDFEVDPLATIFDDAVGSTASIDPSNARFGAKSLLIQQYGTPVTTNRNIPTVNQAAQVLVGRFWVNFVNDVPNVLQQIANLLGVDVNINFNWTSGNHITIGFAGNFTDFGLMAQKTWHSIDFRADARPRPNMTVDLRVDGVPGAQSTVAAGVTPGPWTKIRFGQSGANTIHFWIDGLQLSDNYNDYPLADDPTWAPFVPYVASFTFPHIREIFDPSRIAPLIAPLQPDTTPPVVSTGYTEAATAQINLVASSVETAQFVDATTAPLTLTASATVETAQFVDSTTAQLSLVASATQEVAVLTDSATPTITNVASATETAQFVDATTANATLTASAVENAQYVDATTASITITDGGSTETQVGNAYVDDMFARTVASGSWGTASPSGSAYISDPTTVSSISVDGTHGLIQETGVSGSIHMMQEGFSAADTDSVLTFNLDALPSSSLTYFGPESRMVDSSNVYRARLRFNASGGVLCAIEKVVASTVFTLLSFSNVLSGYTAGTDVSIRFRVQGNTPVNLYTRVWYSASSEPTTWTQSTTDSANSFTSPGFAGVRIQDSSPNFPTVHVTRYTVTPPAAATTTYFDADTPTLTLTASAAETAQTVDATQATVTFTPSGQEAIGDFGTGRVTFTPSGVDQPYIDAQQTLLQLLASFVEVRGTTDTATANFTFTPSAVETLLTNDVGTALLTLVQPPVVPIEFRIGLDSATAQLVLTARTIFETQPFRDYLLVASAQARWSGTTFMRYSGLQPLARYNASFTMRWSGLMVGRDPRG